jgi:hypothetical protein
MKTTINRNGLSHRQIYRLFPMVYAINSEGDVAEVQHDDPLVYPSDEDVSAALLQDRWDKIRAERTTLLIEADWLVARAEDQGVDAPAWRAYRQALRDVTKQPDPDNVTWPSKPQV